MPTFCRHNRFIQNCPICREPEPHARARRSSGASRPSTSAPGPGGARRAAKPPGGGLKVRQMARAADDGYRNDLVPGLKSSADAERLADELGFAAARLAELAADPPGLYADVAAEPDREEALWTAFLVAYLTPADDAEDPFATLRAVRTPWASGEVPDLSAAGPVGERSSLDRTRWERTFAAYRAWAARAGSQEAAVSRDTAWSPERRFERVYERLALPGLPRPARFEFLASAGRLGLADVRAGTLAFADDATTMAAKRVFGIGDVINLQRRAGDLAEEAGMPLEALDLGLFNFGQPPARRARMGSRAEGGAARDLVAAALGV